MAQPEQKPSAWKKFKEKVQSVPSYVWIIVLVVANILSCMALFQTCDSASGRSVDDSLFRPEEDNELDELLEEVVEEKKKEEEMTTVSQDTIDTITFDEMIGANADPLHSEDMAAPNFEEEKLNMNEYDGVGDEEDEEIIF